MTTVEDIKAVVKAEAPYFYWEDILAHFDAESISEEIYDQRRWVTVYEYIGKFGDKYFRMYRGMGSTEYQDHEEMEYAIETLEEVEPVEVKTIKYRPVSRS